jgi:hypothetical protein
MKYMAVLIMLIFMVWTWSMATSERPFRLEQHRSVELEVEEDIRNFILKRHPDTKEIYCQQFYTEMTQMPTDMVVRFRCQAASADDAEATEVTQQTFEGYIRLRSNDGFATWDEVGGEIRSPQIRFLRGITITPLREGQDGAPGDN